ncbi:MAG: NYN domain-containing protein [Candidatus Omnitrophica bacterium]|nr:NYN domain-containing protein [Candidatus Omnitrophota bacterium]MCM8810137.1 NYN domain-containing protein [Candidatus Omnitrophota bacterium]
MEYLIDGLNVIKSSFIKKYGKKTIEFNKEFLIDILEKYKRKHPSIEITVVFDGGPSSFDIYREKRIKIVFSQDITADEKIREILEKKKSRSSISVVSDDREVQEFTKILGSKSLKVSEFLDIVYPLDKKQPINLTKDLEYKSKLKIEKELKNFYEKKIKKIKK